MGLDTSLMRSFAVKKKKKMYTSEFHWKYQKLKEHKYLIQNIFANYAHELCFLPTARNVVLLPLIFRDIFFCPVLLSFCCCCSTEDVQVQLSQPSIPASAAIFLTHLSYRMDWSLSRFASTQRPWVAFFTTGHLIQLV